MAFALPAPFPLMKVYAKIGGRLAVFTWEGDDHREGIRFARDYIEERRELGMTTSPILALIKGSKA